MRDTDFKALIRFLKHKKMFCPFIRNRINYLFIDEDLKRDFLNHFHERFYAFNASSFFTCEVSFPWAGTPEGDERWRDLACQIDSV